MAPLFLIGMGYWQLSNRQLFFNRVSNRIHKTEILDPKHNLFDYNHGVDASLLLLIHIPFFLFLTYYNRFLQKLSYIIRAYNKVEHFNDDWEYLKDVDEQLGSYWRCLNGLDQKRWFTRELHQRNNLGFKFLDDGNLESLRTAKRG